MEFNIEGADFENIAEAKIAEVGTYKLMLTRQEIKSNRAEDGTNMEFDFVIVDDPSCEGITFTLYCALPKPGDDQKMTKRAQSFKDFKLDMLKQTVERIGGTVSGSGVNIPDDAMITANVDKRFSSEGRPFNVLVDDTIQPLAGGKLDLS